MTKTGLLFREYRRENTITWAELKYAGWDKKDYFTYLGLCEELRAATIFLCDIQTKRPLLVQDLPEWKNRHFAPLLKNLLKWLETFFKENLDFRWSVEAMEPYVRYYNSPISEESEAYNKIYTSSDDFRFQIESLINAHLKGDFSGYFGDDLTKLSMEELRDRRERLKSMYGENTEPGPPENMDSYVSLQVWASQCEEYNYLERHCPGDIEAINEEIEWREEEMKRQEEDLRAATFNFESDCLYIYCKSPACLKEHETMSVTARIPDMEGIIRELNVNYCKRCKRFFISVSEYEHYSRLYRFLPVIMQWIGKEGKNGFFQRAEKSPLMLCGYSVSKKDGLSDGERHLLLARIMDCSILSKGEIIDYLEFFISTNGGRSSFLSACRKWSVDIGFVRDYKIQEQRRHELKKVIAKSRDLRIG